MSKDNGEDKPQYMPFAPVEGVYDADDRGMTMERILCSFGTIFGIPKAAIRTVFKTVIREVVDEEYPNFRCSSLRAVLEGRIPDVPEPVKPIHPAWKKRMQQTLYLLDLMETICCRYIEQEVAKQLTNVRQDAQALQRTVGTTKVPWLMEALDHARKAEKVCPKGRSKDQAAKKRAK